MPDQLFTNGQWEAARILVARLLCEAAGQQFSYEQVGLQWLEPDDVVCAVTDKGEHLRMSDFVHSAIILLWSSLANEADLLDEATVEEAVGRLGLRLALHDPSFPEGP